MVDRKAEFQVRTYKAGGAELIMGSGSFVGPKTIDASLIQGSIGRLLARRFDQCRLSSRARELMRRCAQIDARANEPANRLGPDDYEG